MAQPENVRSSAEFLALDDQTLLSQCDIDTYRASGPGGQKRNKTSSAVRLRHGPTASIVTASEDRSQHVNKARALRRLREAIALTVRAPIDAAAYVPSGLLATCISASGRLGVGRRDVRYPPAVGEVLDVLAACGMRISDSADLLGVSTANLVAFIKKDPKLRRRVNEMRASAGFPPLRWTASR